MDSDSPASSEPSGSDAKRRDELLRYLERTATIEGPRRDLVFLESVGSSFGLPAELADLVEADAVDNRAGSVVDWVRKLEQPEREAALKMLASTQRIFHGVEAANVLAVALELVKRELVSASVAPELATALAGMSKGSGLPIDALPAAFRVGSQVGTPAGQELRKVVLQDQRLRDPQHQDVAMEVVKEAAPIGGELLPSVGLILGSQEEGSISAAIEGDLLEPDAWAKVMGPEAWGPLEDRWKQHEVEESEEEVAEAGETDHASRQLADFNSLAALAAESDLQDISWRLLRAAVTTHRGDFVSAWVRHQEGAADSRAQVELVLEAIEMADTEDWQDLTALLENSPKVSSSHLYYVLARVSNDLRAREGWDETNEAVWARIKEVWGEPVWPEDFDEADFPQFNASPWGTEDRTNQHRLLRELSELDVASDRWTAALVGDYSEALGSANAIPSIELLTLIEESAADWELFDKISRQSLLEQIRESPLLGSDAKQCWLAHLSHLEGGPAFPLDSTSVPSLVGSESSFDIAVIRMWLRHEVSDAGLVKTFLERLEATDQKISTFRASLAACLRRLGRQVASDIMCALVELHLPLDEQDGKTILQAPLEEHAFGECLGELLREASNEEQRIYLLGVWRLFNPADPAARRSLIEALRLTSEGGKGAFRLALKNLDLAQDPPHGTKGKLVETIKRRGRDFRLSKEAENALLEAELVRVKRKGFFGIGRETEMTSDQ